MRTYNRTRSAIIEELLEIAKNNGFDLDTSSINWGALVIDFNYYSLIFRHDFAKALWGEEEEYKKMVANYKRMEEQGVEVDYSLIPPPSWKRNLEALVTAEDKFLFLETHLDALQKGEITEEEKDKRREELMARLRKSQGR